MTTRLKLAITLAGCLLATLLATSLATSAWAQPIMLSPGFAPDPMVLEGTAGGSIDASAHGNTPTGGCMGFIAATPSHELTLTRPFEYLALNIEAPGDTTVVIEGPEGDYWCNDDSVGLNPGMYGRWRAGDYRIFVGTYSEAEVSAYTMTFSQGWDRREMAETPIAPPPTGFALEPIPPVEATPYRPPILPGQGDDQVERDQPEPPILPDTVVPVPVVEPEVVQSYVGDLEVGSHSSSGASTTVGEAIFLPQTLVGESGGSVSAPENVPIDRCFGWVAAQPNHVIHLADPMALSFSVNSAGDNTMVFQGPDGFQCNDDAIGLNPQVTGSFQPGTYRIWIGTYNQSESHPYSLTISPPY